MKPKQVQILGMCLDEWRLDSCIAHFGVGDSWATLFDIESKIKKKGHATSLLREAKTYYEAQGKKVGGTVALNPVMAKIYRKLKIKEYKPPHEEVMRWIKNIVKAVEMISIMGIIILR